MATSSSTASVARATLTVVGQAGATLSAIVLPPAPSTTRAAAAASIFDPSRPNPVDFDPTNPLVLFIVQAFIIVAISRILGFFLAKIRQPKVIAEVIAGILIGPSVLGRIPDFTRRIFPAPSIPYLSLVANLGLCLFLFLVGMETDFSVFKRNYRASVSISLIGMVIPFALGAAVSVGIYDNFVDQSKSFGTFLLFIGVANAITAFPVLARILTELEMLHNHVGVITLAAGVGNDVVGWILLALAIALVNAASGIIVLYVILTSIGWILALFLIGKPALHWLGRKTNSYGEKGPAELMTCVTLFLSLASAWVTDRIGIHAIFGSFLVGLIVPVPIRAPLTEKIEDLVSVLLLPLYFALSGLKTDLGLLANGSIWGWVVCVIVVAFASKFLSCGAMAKLNGLNWRESGAVGSLMACKGLVELIVLNIGLNAGILNPSVFAIFVTMALVTTFVTTPLTLLFYPKAYRLKTERERREREAGPTQSRASHSGDDNNRDHSRFSVVLEQFDHLSAVFTFCRLIKAPIQYAESDRSSGSSEKGKRAEDTPVSVAALRLVELTDRTSALIKASSQTEQSLLKADTLSSIFKSFATSLGIHTSSSLTITGPEAYDEMVKSHAEREGVDCVVVPWALTSMAASEGESEVIAASTSNYLPPNPFANLFGRGPASREGSPHYASFVRKVFADANTNVALFVDRGTESDSKALLSGRSHIFFPFHGGSDDRMALSMLLQLVDRNPGLSATVLRVERAAAATVADHDEDRSLSTKTTGGTTAPDTPVLFSQLTVQGGGGATDTVYPPTGHDLGSETADNIAFETLLGFEPDRVTSTTVSTSQPLHMTIARLRACASSLPTGAHAAPVLTILLGRSRRDAPSHTHELAEYLKENLERVQSSICASSEVRRCFGDLATAAVVSGLGANVLVVQSKMVSVARNKDA